MDNNGRLTLEPVSFTLGIFKQSVRRTAAAWRTIGYCINQSELSYKDGSDKAEDYHFVLNEILKPFKQLQKSSLVRDFEDKKGNKVRKYCIFPILQIIGDTEGHDKLVCRKAGYTRHHVTFCRICACPIDETDNPDYKCTHLNSKEIGDAVENDDFEYLDQIGHYYFLSAFHDCLYCDPIRGLYGCVCSEHLHVNQQGNFKRTIKGLFSEKKLIPSERKRRSEELANVNSNDARTSRKHKRRKTNSIVNYAESEIDTDTDSSTNDVPAQDVYQKPQEKEKQKTRFSPIHIPNVSICWQKISEIFNASK